MFKPISAIIALILCTMLIIFSPAASSAAKKGLELWLQIVLPTLFPFFVCVRLIERSGFIWWAAKKLQPISHKLHISVYIIPIALLSILGGYPCGARICAMLHQQKCIDKETADRLGTCCNLCSPVFLLSAVSLGMYHDILFFPVIAISHYGSALISAFIWNFLFPLKETHQTVIHSPSGISCAKALPDAIGEGMSGMLQVGGCIIFFMVLLQIIDAAGIFVQFSHLPFFGKVSEILRSFFCGILEMTNGCYALAQSSLSAPIQSALCSFFVSFGGLCVMFQALSFLPLTQPVHYLGYKILQGTTAALIAYFLSSLFIPPATETLYIALKPEQSAIQSFGTVFICTITGLIVSLLLGIIGSKLSLATKKRSFRYNTEALK